MYFVKPAATEENAMPTPTYPIDLYQYEVGTLFTYDRPRDWCRDGKAVIIEAFNRRWLVDTYWGDTEDELSAAAAATAVVAFIPSEHREITKAQAEVYGDEKVIRITRQHGSYVKRYVRADVPELTELDYCRHDLATEEQRHRDALDEVKRTASNVERLRARLANLEAAQ